MPLLSLCLIARDEASMLPGLLASVRGAVDEIVLVDTGSTDGTVALAREAGARVLERPWDDDFSAPRNLGLSEATGEWVLVLDADERLAPGAGAALRALLEAGPAFDCGQLPLHNATRLDSPAGEVLSGAARRGEPSWVPRVLRNVDGLRYEGFIHESVTEWLARRGMRLENLPGVDVVHLGAVPELRAQRGKVQRNQELLRRQCAAQPGNAVPWGYYALELWQAGQATEARAAAEAGWRVLPDQPAWRSGLRVAVARALEQASRDDFAGVLDTVATLERREGPSPDLAYLAGCGHELRGYHAGGEAALEAWRTATVAFQRCLETTWPPHTLSLVTGASGWAAATRLGTCRSLLGDWAGAREAFARAVPLAPTAPEALEARLGLAEAALESGDAMAALQAAPTLVGPEPDGWVLAAAAALAVGARADAQLFVQRALERARGPFVARHRLPRLARLKAALGAPPR